MFANYSRISVDSTVIDSCQRASLFQDCLFSFGILQKVDASAIAEVQGTFDGVSIKKSGGSIIRGIEALIDCLLQKFRSCDEIGQGKGRGAVILDEVPSSISNAQYGSSRVGSF